MRRAIAPVHRQSALLDGVTEASLQFHDLLHACRSECLARLPAAQHLLSLDAHVEWYLAWFYQCYPHRPERHVVIAPQPEPAERSPEVQWIRGDGADLCYLPDGAFDLVYAGRFLDRCAPAHQATLLAECNRVLRPGGFLAVEGVDWAVANRFGWAHPAHAHAVTFAQMLAALQLAGFLDTTTYGLVPAPLLGPLSPCAGRFVRAHDGFDDLPVQTVADGLKGRPGNAFGWWITARRVSAAVPVAHLTEELERAAAANAAQRLERVFTPCRTLVAHADGAYLRATPADGEVLVLFGPYAEYPTGRYLVRFELALDPPPDGPDDWQRPVCRLDVAAEPDATVLVEKTVRVADLLRLDGPTLQFELTGPTVLEFRVTTLGTLPLLVGVRPRVYSCGTSSEGASRS